MLVVDSNVVVSLYLDPLQTPVLGKLLQCNHTWVAPNVWQSELRSILAYFQRKGQLDMERAIEVMTAAEALLGRQEHESSSAHVLSLALSSGCSAYDCEFVALARDLGTVLITFDKKLLASFPNIAITPATYLASSAST